MLQIKISFGAGAGGTGQDKKTQKPEEKNQKPESNPL